MFADLRRVNEYIKADGCPSLPQLGGYIDRVGHVEFTTIEYIWELNTWLVNNFHNSYFYPLIQHTHPCDIYTANRGI